MNPVSIIAQTPEPIFAEMISGSSRKVRETLFSKMGIKSKAKSVGIKLHEKRDERTKKLHEKLSSATSKGESEICSELIRTWLYGKRAMLKSALDFLGVANDDGLVESDLDFFKEMSEERSRELVNHLSKSFEREEIKIYLSFVEVPFVDKIVN